MFSVLFCFSQIVYCKLYLSIFNPSLITGQVVYGSRLPIPIYRHAPSAYMALSPCMAAMQQELAPCRATYVRPCTRRTVVDPVSLGSRCAPYVRLARRDASRSGVTRHSAAGTVTRAIVVRRQLTCAGAVSPDPAPAPAFVTRAAIPLLNARTVCIITQLFDSKRPPPAWLQLCYRFSVETWSWWKPCWPRMVFRLELFHICMRAWCNFSFVIKW